MADSKSHHRFFAELKRRQVFRIMAVYGIVGFLVLQVVDLAVPALLLPDWTYRLVALLLLVGFPVAVVLAWAFEVTPEGVRRAEAASPGEIDAIVAQPASARWPSGLLALVGVALLVGGAWWMGRRSGPAAGEDSGSMRLVTGEGAETRPSIAVLPFADMSPEGDQEYFSDGMTEEILNTLAKISGLKVMARHSAFAFKGQNVDIRSVGDSLGVRYVLEGSVRKFGDQLRITAQLIDASDGSHLLSEQYDRQLLDVFAIQTEIAEAIAKKLLVPLGLDEGERLVSPTEDLEAYDLYLAGRARMRERGESIPEAVKLFEAAVARDSTWAPAWAGLAESLSLYPHYTDLPRDSTLWATSLANAERAATKALELDPDDASALVALGNVHRDRWDWEQAEAAYRRALSIDPENVEGQQQYAEFLSYVGRLDEAYQVAQSALALDRAPIRLNIAGLMAQFNGRYGEAETLFEEGIRRDPSGQVQALRNNMGRNEIYRITSDWAEFRRVMIAYVDSAYGEAPAAKIRSAWPVEGSPPPPEWPSLLEAAGHSIGFMEWTLYGDHDRAFEGLEESTGARPPFGDYPRALFDPIFDPLRDDPRFEALLARMNLAGRRPQRLDPSQE